MDLLHNDIHHGGNDSNQIDSFSFPAHISLVRERADENYTAHQEFSMGRNYEIILEKMSFKSFSILNSLPPATQT
jgi:spore coat protein CotH